MNIVRRRPFSWFDELQREMDRAFDARSPTSLNESSLLNDKSWVPAVDIEDKENAYLITVDLPGVAPEEIDVTTHENYLRIKGERESKSEDKDLKRSERVYGSFLREFSMPKNADLGKISARSNHGVLELTVPKSMQAPEPTRITVERG